MNKRFIHGSLLVFLGGLGVAGAAYLGEGPRRNRALLVPDGAFLVIRGDVSTLRKGAAFSALPLDKIGVWLNGDRASRLCGFDPTTRIGEFLAVIPEGGDKGEFAIAAKTTVTKEDLVRCAESLAREGGQGLTTKTEGRDTSMTLPKQEGELVYREGGILAIGQRPFLSVLLLTLDGKLPPSDARSPHVRLAHDFGGATDSPSAPSQLVATVVLPRSLREKLRAENRGPDGTNAMAGVLGVEAAGLSLTTGPSGGMTELKVRFSCDGPQACAEVDKLLMAQRLKLSQHLGLRIAGFGPFVDSFRTEQAGSELSANARIRTDDLSRAIGFAADYLGKVQASALPSPTSDLPAAELKSAPDELLRPQGSTKKNAAEKSVDTPPKLRPVPRK